MNTATRTRLSAHHSEPNYATVTATDIHRGQHPYGPTIHEARLTFRRRSPFLHEGEVPLYVNAERAKQAFRLLCQDGWKDTSEPVTEMFETRLVKCEREDPAPWADHPTPSEDRSDSWLIRIERPYDD